MRDVVSSELPAIGRGPSRDVFEVLMPSHDDMIETLEHEMRRGGVDAFKFRNPRLTLAQAERLCERLQDSELHGIYPFDLPGTQKVWEGVDHRGVSYRQIATRQYLERHYGSSETDADFRSIEGFRRVLREFTYSHFTSEPINRFGTRLAGMAQYFAPAPHLGQTCVLEVVHGDPELSEVRAFGVSVADFTYSGEYSDKSGAPLPSTLSALKSLVCSIAGIYERETGTTLDIRRPEDFAKILPRLTRTAFSTVPVSNWGTTIDGILDSVLYRSDAPSAYLDLISRDEDFVAIRKIGIREWDFQSPNETWSIRNASGVLEPTELAREFTGTLIKQLGEKLGVDPTSPMGFREVLARLKTDTYQKTKVGFWGTTGMSCLRQAYGGSVSAAVLDLISTAPQYFQIRLIGILPEDFPRAPNNYWKDPAGNPSANARRIMLRWLAMIARDQGLDLETEEGVVKAQKYISPKRARKAELNFWGTTPFGVLQSAYDGESKSVIDDLRSNGSKIGLPGFSSELPDTTTIPVSSKDERTDTALVAASKYGNSSALLRQFIDYLRGGEAIFFGMNELKSKLGYHSSDLGSEVLLLMEDWINNLEPPYSMNKIDDCIQILTSLRRDESVRLLCRMCQMPSDEIKMKALVGIKELASLANIAFADLKLMVGLPSSNIANYAIFVMLQVDRARTLESLDDLNPANEDTADYISRLRLRHRAS